MTTGDFLEAVEATGRIAPANTWNVAASHGGLVERVNFSPGDRAERGDVLVELSNPRLEAMVLESELSLVSAQSSVATDHFDDQREILRLEEELLTLRAEANDAATTSENDARFLGQGFISEARARRSELRAAAAREKLAAANGRLRILRDAIQKRSEANDRSLALQNEVHEVLLENVRKLSVTAPESALVTAVHVNMGQQVTDGHPLVELSSGNRLKANLDVPEAQSRKLSGGLAAEVRTGNTLLHGSVARIFPTVNDGYVRVDIALEREGRENLRAGRFVEGSITLNRRKDQVLLERPHWIRPGSSTHVYRISTSPLKAVRTGAVFGPGNRQFIVVESGLAPGDTIVAENTSDWVAESVELH